MNNPVTLRPAVAADAPAIAELLHSYALQGVLLDRSVEDILFYLKNFTVAVDDSGLLLGCMAVRDFGNNLLEVRSLAVRADLCRSGIGRQLVMRAIANLEAQGGDYRLFALTLQPGFFEKLNFRIVEKELFPEKIWSDCSHCPKQHCCDEYAVIYDNRAAAI